MCETNHKGKRGRLQEADVVRMSKNLKAFFALLQIVDEKTI
jgi:hypothetical protein